MKPSDADPTAVAARVKHERTNRGWTLDELARRTSIPKSALWKIEQGSRPVRVAEVVAFAEAFGGMPVQEMFTPMWAVDERDAQRLLEAVSGSMAMLYSAAGDLVESVRDLASVRERNEEVFTYVVNQLAAAVQRRAATDAADPVREYAHAVVADFVGPLIDHGWAVGTPDWAIEQDPDSGNWRATAPQHWGSDVVPYPGRPNEDHTATTPKTTEGEK